MPRKKATAEQRSQETPAGPAAQGEDPTDFDPARLEQQSGPRVGQVSEAAQVPDQRQPGDELPEPANGRESPKKQWVPPADPFGFENKLGAEGNRVRLLKSEGEGAWVIRFTKPPNEMEGYSKNNPHPVLAYLKGEGFHWGFDGGDGKGGHGKPWQGDPYGTDHMEARRVLAEAAKMVGARIEEGQGVAR